MIFGIATNIRSKVQECTPALMDETLDSAHVAGICAEIEDALEACRRGELTRDEYDTLKGELKKRLPIFTFHATFKNGRRKNDEAIPSGLSIYDLDHIANPRARWDEIAPRKEELGIVMAHISPSLEGLRLVFTVPMGMTLAEAQAWMARQLGDTHYDACVKDYARCSFAVPRGYVLCLNEGLFMREEGKGKSEELMPEADASGDSLRATLVTPPSPCDTHDTVVQGTALPSLSTVRHLVDPQKASLAINRGGVVEALTHPEGMQSTNCPSVYRGTSTECGGSCFSLRPANFVSKQSAEQYPTEFEGLEYGEIVSVLEEQMGGRPEHGSRNNFIFSMACHLRYVTNDDPEWIASILPTYGEARDKWMATIRSACNRNQTKTMPRIMKRTLAICRQRTTDEGEQTTDNGQLPPPMPKRLPPLIKLLVSRTPKVYQAAVAHAVFPALATYLWKTTFRYIDNVEHEATLMNVLMAGSGAGKNCISEPINHILRDIRRRDADNLSREREWKREMQTKGANKDKRQRPEGLVIQEIDPDMTNAAFVQRLADAEERFLYAKMNEIDQFDALKTSARSKAHFQIMCLAFDPGNVYGQTRVGTSSVSERVCIRFNWNASTTILKGKQYFRNVLTDGPISRINFCTIPEREIGAEMPVYGTYDAAFDEELRPYIENLTRARGLVDCPEAYRLARKLSKENAEFARLSQSRVFENLSFRANVIAWLKACVLYVANGCEWEKSMEAFVRWSLEYDMWCKMEFFGKAIEDAQNAGVREGRRGPRNLLELLPDEFTTDDAVRLRQSEGMDVKNTRPMLYQWMKRGYIEQKTENSFFKLKFKRKEE